VLGNTYNSANYNVVNVNGTLTVSPEAITVTASAVSQTYGTLATPTAFSFTPTTIPNGLTASKFSATLTATGDSATAPAASTFSIVPSALTATAAPALTNFASGNYTITYAPGTLTVNPRPVVLTGAESYTGSATAPATALAIANVVGGDQVGLNLAGSVTLAGSYVTNTPWAITGNTASLAPLTGAQAADYTVTGATGSVYITNSFPALTTTTSLSANGSTLTICWNSQPGVVYNVLTNGSVGGNGPATFTTAGTVNGAIAASQTCFTLPGNIAAGTNGFVVIQQNTY
jgi:hypothetical protein